MSWFNSDIPLSIEVDNLVVRQYRLSDAPLLVDAVTRSLPELLQWMPWAKFEPQTVEQRGELIEQWVLEWEKKTNFTMGIFLHDECVGGTGFHLRGEDGELEIGYWVSTAHTKMGIATRVSAALVDVAFSFAEVEKVAIAHDVANNKSQRIPELLGFKVSREFARTPEAPSETGVARVWSMTRDEWRNR